MKRKPRPTVGMAFWRLHPLRGYVRHEVRALVDAMFVHRHWMPRRQNWFYECDGIWLWRFWLERREFPSVVFSAQEARELNAKRKKAA